jgi:hypothetical protein
MDACTPERSPFGLCTLSLDLILDTAIVESADRIPQPLDERNQTIPDQRNKHLF